MNDDLDTNGQNALFKVTNVKDLKFLVENRKMNYKARDYHYRTPLHYAKTPKIAEYFISLGLEVNDAKTDAKDTPLHLVNNVMMAEFFINNGALPDLENIFGKTALHTAKNEFITEVLLKKGNFNSNALDYNRNSALHYAINGNQTRSLIANGANPNVKNIFDENPLHKANDENQTRSLLAAEKCNVNDLDNTGSTPLHYANNFRQTRVLLENGANPNIKNDHGHRALDYSKSVSQINVLIYEGKMNLEFKDKIKFCLKNLMCCFCHFPCCCGGYANQDD